jgi:hypothetical protein
MGAEVFIHITSGETAEKAFWNAVSEAQYDHGHSGYSGTIAEKCDFVMIDLPEDKDYEEYAYDLINEGDERIDDKWGPAGCFKLLDDNYLFFGTASS